MASSSSSCLYSKPFMGSALITKRHSGLCSDLPSLHFSVRPFPAKMLQVQGVLTGISSVLRLMESLMEVVLVDGVPPRRPLSEADLQADLDRRRPGQSRITTPRKETDTCKILSGVQGGLTTGTPIHVFVPNTDQRGGLRVISLGVLILDMMIAAIDTVRVKGESIGGVVTCIVRNCPRVGLGSPVFDKELAKACMSLPATKGFEFGSGFAGTFLTGSEHNDEFYVNEQGRVRTRTNRSGGTLVYVLKIRFPPYILDVILW